MVFEPSAGLGEEVPGDIVFGVADPGVQARPDPAARVKVVPNGIDPALFRPDAAPMTVAPYDSTVLILGESGTGKELGALHDGADLRTVRAHGRHDARELLFLQHARGGGCIGADGGEGY